MNASAFVIVCRLAARRAVADLGGMVVTIGFYLMVVAMLAGVWRVAAHANGGAVAGYSGVSLTWYIATTEAVTVSLRMRLIADTGREIGSGEIAVELLRPASVLAMRMAAELGYALPRLCVCGLAGAAIAAFTAGAPRNEFALVLVVPAMVLAIACNIAAQHAFAAIAFWLRDAGSAWFLYQKLVFVLGGMLIPLQALPHSMHVVAQALPFAAMAYAPARLASGHLEPILLVEQSAWLIVLCATAWKVFALGERRLQVVGG